MLEIGSRAYARAFKSAGLRIGILTRSTQPVPAVSTEAVDEALRHGKALVTVRVVRRGRVPSSPTVLQLDETQYELAEGHDNRFLLDPGVHPIRVVVRQSSSRNEGALVVTAGSRVNLAYRVLRGFSNAGWFTRV